MSPCRRCGCGRTPWSRISRVSPPSCPPRPRGLWSRSPRRRTGGRPAARTRGPGGRGTGTGRGHRRELRCVQSGPPRTRCQVPEPRPAAGPIRGEEGGHVTSSPPITAHLGPGCLGVRVPPPHHHGQLLVQAEPQRVHAAQHSEQPRHAAQAGNSRVELSTNLREVLQCPEKAPTRAFFLCLLPTSTGTFTIKNILRHYAYWTFKLGIWEVGVKLERLSEKI